MIDCFTTLLLNYYFTLRRSRFSRLAKSNIVMSAIIPKIHNRMNAKLLLPVNPATIDSTIGGKKPPKPPIIETIPFATPASLLK